MDSIIWLLAVMVTYAIGFCMFAFVAFTVGAFIYGVREHMQRKLHTGT
jgi:hypothetical protein